MAQRRMFSKDITNSSDFLMMSQSAQNLYFHLGMNADDDGFCEVFTIMRMTDSKPDDLQSLHTRGLIYVIDNKVCIVKDWHENNQLRVDRYKQSKYFDDPYYKEIYLAVMEEKIKEISLYSQMLTNRQPNGNQMATQYSIGKGRIVKSNKEKESDKEKENPDQTPSKLGDTPKDQMQYFLENYEKVAEVIAKKKNLEYNTINAEVKKFIDYWTEKNPSGTKQRWQMQKTFEVQKRLTTWLNNAQKYNGRTDTTPKVITI